MEENMPNNMYENEKPKKNVGLIVGIVVAAIVVIGAICVAVATFALGDSAEKKADKAFDKMADEFAQYTTSIADEIGFDKLGEYVGENPMHVYLDLSVTLPDNEDLGNLSLELDGISDLKSNSWETDVEAGAYGFSLNLGSLVYNDGDFYVQSRFLGSDTYKIALEGFAEKFNNSAWSEMLGTQIPEDTFDTVINIEAADYSEYGEQFAQVFSDVRDNIKYSSIKGKREFEIDGKNVKCSGIEVVLDKDYLNNAIDDLADIYEEIYDANGDYEDEYEAFEALKSVELLNDLVFDIYLDSKGYIVNMSTPEDIEFSGSTDEAFIEAISFDLNFTGSERRADNITGDIYIKVDDEIVCINIDREALVSDDEYDENLTVTFTSDDDDNTVAFSYSNKWDSQDKSFDMTISLEENNEESYAVSANGDFDDIVSGQAYTFNLKNAKISSQGENLLIISGQYTYEPSETGVEIPSDSIELLDMTSSEIEDMAYSIIGNIYSGLY